jgi:uncharacterized alkaline shock family protein YloU
MNPFDRVLTVLYALTGIIAAFLAGSALAGWAWHKALFRYVAGTPGFNETAYTLLAVSVLAGMRLVWLGIRRGTKHVVVQEGTLGQVRIALAAIESLVEKTALEQRGVSEARAGVESLPRGIGVRVRIIAAPEISIPQMSQTLQNLVGERVLEVTGIELGSIKIQVDNISTRKVRVE